VRGHFATRQEHSKRARAVHDTIVASFPQFPVRLPFFAGPPAPDVRLSLRKRSNPTTLMVKRRRCILTLGQEAS